MFASDRAVSFSVNGGGDLLGRTTALKTLFDVLHQIDAPSCVAVYGGWGTGKTSLIKAAYDGWSGGPAVWFDPWEQEGKGDVLSPLLFAVAQAQKADPSEKVKKAVLGIVRVLSKISLKAAATLSGVELELDDLSGEALHKAFSPVAKYANEVATVKADFAKLVDELTDNNPHQRAIIFLDDLDRCLPHTVVTLVESIKLLLCSRDTNARVVFVFAVDRKVVGEAIRQRYGGVSSYTGENYLEKIFDFTLEMPQVGRTELPMFVQRLVKSLAASYPQCKADLPQLGEEFKLVLSSACLANPRVIKRVFNRLWRLLGCIDADAELAGLDETQRRSFLIWLAGTERYRLFRHFVYEASPREFWLLHRYLTEDDPPEVPTRVAEVAEQPDFTEYYALLALSQIKTRAEQFIARDRLLELDGILRSRGL